MSVAGLSFETATSRMALFWGVDLLVAEAILAKTEVRFSVSTAARLGGICISEQEWMGVSIGEVCNSVQLLRQLVSSILWYHLDAEKGDCHIDHFFFLFFGHSAH